MNTTHFIGNLGKAPTEIRLTKAGTAVTNFQVAVDNPFTGRTTWIPVVVFGKIAEAAIDFLDKGDEVGVTGELAMNEWDDDLGHHQQLQVIARSLDFLRHRKTASDDTASELEEAF